VVDIVRINILARGMLADFYFSDTDCLDKRTSEYGCGVV
jgi:hypothetical protein